MGLEGNKGYSRQAYEDTEKGIEDLALSVDTETPPDQIRERFAEQSALMGEKESLHNEAWDQAKVEDTARDEAKEAAELLQKMHENAGIKPETAPQNVDAQKERTVESAAVLSPEQQAWQEKQEELKKLYESLNLPHSKKGTDNLYSRESVDKEGGIGHKIDTGLRGEIYNDEQKRKKFFWGSMFTAMPTLLTSLGGLVASGTEASVFGYSGAALATAGFGIGAAGIGIAATGALGWAGMKAWHAYKEHRHAKKFVKLAHEY